MSFRASALRGARPTCRLQATRVAEIQAPTSSDGVASKKKKAKDDDEDSDEDDFLKEEGDGLEPQQVESLLATLCDGTDLAHLELSLPGFRLRVGVFRRGRYVKGKRVGKGPLATAGDSVKKGQVLAFVEQLGTHWPIESPQSGEVEGFLLEDGDPVEYNQSVLELTPFFGGHIIGDKKYR